MLQFSVFISVTDERQRCESSAISVSSGESDYSGNGRIAPTPFNSTIDKRIPYYQGNQINNPEMDWSCHGHDVNGPQQRPNTPLCEELEFDSDENGSSNYSGSSSSNGFLRIKRKHLRRRFLSSPDTTGNVVEKGGLKREPHSEPNFGIQYGNTNQGGYQHVAKDVAEKVAQRYRRRASTDIGDLRPPSRINTEASIQEKLSSSPMEGNIDRRQSLPAKMPRKLRPIFPKGRPIDSGHNSDSSNEDRKGSENENPKLPQGLVPRKGSLSLRLSILVSDDSDRSYHNSPNVPRRDSFNQSDPLLQGKPIENDTDAGRRNLKPIKPLKIDVPEGDDVFSEVGENLPMSPPDSAFMSLPTSPRNNLPTLSFHRHFEPGTHHHRLSSDSGLGSRTSSLIPANDEDATMAALVAHRDEVMAKTAPRRGSDTNKGHLNGLMPLGGILKKPLCHTRSAPDSAVISQC